MSSLANRGRGTGPGFIHFSIDLGLGIGRSLTPFPSRREDTGSMLNWNTSGFRLRGRETLARRWCRCKESVWTRGGDGVVGLISIVGGGGLSFLGLLLKTPLKILRRNPFFSSLVTMLSVLTIVVMDPRDGGLGISIISCSI